MKRAILIITVLFIAVISTACINNFAVQELNNKAQMYLNNGDYEAAIDRLQASLDLDSTIYETNYNLGVAYIKANKYKEAIDVLKKAAEINPERSDSYYSLAVAQESYAHQLLNMNIQSSNENNNLSEDDMDETETDMKTADDTVLSMSPERRKITARELYASAMSSYKTYLEKAPDAKDKEQVDSEIKSLEEEIRQLGQCE